MARRIQPRVVNIKSRLRLGRIVTESRTRLKWYGERVAAGIEDTLTQRLTIVGKFVRDKVVLNISIPVTKKKSSRTGRLRAIERSLPGEFPRADTARLRGDIFLRVVKRGSRSKEARIGTTLKYGLILEVSESLDRSFLVRTLLEERPLIEGILLRPMKISGGPPISF